MTEKLICISRELHVITHVIHIGHFCLSSLFLFLFLAFFKHNIYQVTTLRLHHHHHLDGSVAPFQHPCDLSPLLDPQAQCLAPTLLHLKLDLISEPLSLHSFPSPLDELSLPSPQSLTCATQRPPSQARNGGCLRVVNGIGEWHPSTAVDGDCPPVVQDEDSGRR